MAHILLVDDDQVLQRMLVALFHREGHEVVVAENGYAALEKLSREIFQLVISDANMPGGLSGFSLVSTIKADKTLRHIPVIFLTGRNQKNDVVRARQSGVSEYLIKPVNHKLLTEKVNSLIEASRAGGSPLVAGDVGASGHGEFQFRIIDMTAKEIEFLSPVALPKEFHFKIHSDLFVQIGIKPPRLNVQTCLPFKYGDEAFHVRARYAALKESEVGLLSAWISQQTAAKVAG